LIVKTESQLISLAQWNGSEEVVNNSMKELRERFDKTYGWCADCDDLVTKEKDCCLNQPAPTPEEEKKTNLFMGSVNDKSW